MRQLVPSAPKEPEGASWQASHPSPNCAVNCEVAARLRDVERSPYPCATAPLEGGPTTSFGARRSHALPDDITKPGGNIPLSPLSLRSCLPVPVRLTARAPCLTRAGYGGGGGYNGGGGNYGGMVHAATHPKRSRRPGHATTTFLLSLNRMAAWLAEPSTRIV